MYNSIWGYRRDGIVTVIVFEGRFCCCASFILPRLGGICEYVLNKPLCFFFIAWRSCLCTQLFSSAKQPCNWVCVLFRPTESQNLAFQKVILNETQVATSGGPLTLTTTHITVLPPQVLICKYLFNEFSPAYIWPKASVIVLNSEAKEIHCLQ